MALEIFIFFYSYILFIYLFKNPFGLCSADAQIPLTISITTISIAIIIASLVCYVNNAAVSVDAKLQWM